MEFPGKGGIVATEQLPGQGVLAGIMPVEGAFGDPGRGGDVPDEADEAAQAARVTERIIKARKS